MEEAFKNNQPKILMVDDRPENLVALERLLRDLPVTIFKANGGNEALKLTIHHDFALALLDIQMPEMDGYELAEILRHDDKTMNMPFIFISAIYTDSINIFQGYEKGAFSYITKPFEPEVLISKVKFFIDKYKQEQALKIKTRQLEVMNEELESFSYSVSHDLRAPLRAIGGFSKVLHDKAAEQLNPEYLRFLHLIVENVDKMEHLIDDLLAFSRMSRQKQTFSVIDTNELIKQVISDLSQAEPDAKNTFEVCNLPEIHADKQMMHHVFSNLIGNAIKYSSHSEKPLIQVCGNTDENETTISIKDNGVGFDMEYSHKLFKIFQRLHDETEFEGTGLGLAIVKRIITRHNGRVWASAEVGKGATFNVSIPNLK